mmetsp:Transcript_538/g.1274  ORF Transcript_538/g.1274 Transcript_538/m.1274 type:complete len:253 (-) Transcript_538:240-998(-)
MVLRWIPIVFCFLKNRHRPRNSNIHSLLVRICLQEVPMSKQKPWESELEQMAFLPWLLVPRLECQPPWVECHSLLPCSVPYCFPPLVKALRIYLFAPVTHPQASGKACLWSLAHVIAGAPVALPFVSRLPWAPCVNVWAALSFRFVASRSASWLWRPRPVSKLTVVVLTQVLGVASPSRPQFPSHQSDPAIQARQHPLTGESHSLASVQLPLPYPLPRSPRLGSWTVPAGRIVGPISLGGQCFPRLVSRVVA